MFRTFHSFQVLKHGTALGRSVDLSHFDGYEELISELDQMFEFKGSLIDGSGEWKVTYMDDEGDLMLVGDYEWQLSTITNSLCLKLYLFNMSIYIVILDCKFGIDLTSPVW